MKKPADPHQYNIGSFKLRNLGWRFRVYFNEGDTSAKFAQGNTGTGGKVAANFVVGNTSVGCNGWRGNIDDVRIYNRALTQAGVGQLYVGTMPGSGTTSAPAAPANLLAIPAPCIITVSGQNRLTLTFTPQQVVGLRYVVQASTDLSDWSDQSDLTDQLTPGQPFTFTDSADLAATPRRFLRLRVTLEP